jgi:hypothetical protein
MPDHIHALIAFRNTGQSINTIVGNGKRFIGRNGKDASPPHAAE